MIKKTKQKNVQFLFDEQTWPDMGKIDTMKGVANGGE